MRIKEGRWIKHILGNKFILFIIHYFVKHRFCTWHWAYRWIRQAQFLCWTSIPSLQFSPPSPLLDNVSGLPCPWVPSRNWSERRESEVEGICDPGSLPVKSAWVGMSFSQSTCSTQKVPLHLIVLLQLQGLLPSLKRWEKGAPSSDV